MVTLSIRPWRLIFGTLSGSRDLSQECQPTKFTQITGRRRKHHCWDINMRLFVFLVLLVLLPDELNAFENNLLFEKLLNEIPSALSQVFYKKTGNSLHPGTSSLSNTPSGYILTEGFPGDSCDGVTSGYVSGIGTDVCFIKHDESGEVDDHLSDTSGNRLIPENSPFIILVHSLQDRYILISQVDSTLLSS